ncbi:MAG TPA: efflux RND transporter periplasmic adaptor subunit [Hyphomicrobiaceae bacterium]|nr:efflux RND transporter periplasmic adaptor subunit [Hyphomicrobiaceae bacterium]
MAPRTETPPSTFRTLLRRLRRILLVAGLLAGSYWLWENRQPELRQLAGEAQRGWAALSARLEQPASPSPAKPAPAPVRVETVSRKDFPIVLTGLGTVQATNMVTVRSRVDGQIVKVAFEEGQMLKEGDLLVQVDPAPFKAALEQAVAKLAQDQASLANARQDLERTIPLAKQGVSTRQLLDQRTAAVASLTALVQADQAAIESAKVQLDYTTIKAPLAGRAGFRLVDPGNIVHASDQTGILTITQLQPISVVFTAPEQQLPAINEALKSGPLQVTAFASDGQKRLGDGTLRLVDNQVDTASGTIKLKASFPNDDNALWPGLSVTTRLLVSTVRNAVVVPDSAVQRGPDGLFAYVVTDKRHAELRDLQVERIAEGMALVEKGLAPGDRVITAGHYRVQPGAPVAIVGGAARPVSLASPAAVAEEAEPAKARSPPKPRRPASAKPARKSPARREARP